MKSSAPKTQSSLFKRALAFLAVVGAIGLAVAVAPPGGSVIGNQATATYTDSTGASRTSTSNLVQTTVAQVNGFSLTAAATKSVAPGSTVYFPHTITNTGNGADTYTLAATDTGAGPASALCTGGTVAAPTPANCNVFIYPDADGNGVPDSNVFLIGATPSIAAGDTYKFVMAYNWPAATPVGTDQITLTATSVGGVNGSASAGNQVNIDNITATLGPVINATKALSSSAGATGVTTTVSIAYTNTGGGAGQLTIADPLPAGMVYVAGSGKWSGCAGVALTDATGAETGACAGNITYSYTAAGTKIDAIINSVAAGSSGTLTFDVTISPTAAVGTSTTTNTATFATGAGAAVSTNPASYNVLASSGVVANNDGAVNTNTAAFNTVTVATAAQGSTVWFANRIWNTGNTSDSFDIIRASSTFPAATTITFYSDTAPAAATCAAATSGTTQPATAGAPLTDSNGNGAVDTGPIGAGFCKIVWTRVDLLSNTTGGPYNLVKTARSINDPSKMDDVTDALTTIVARVVDLTNGAQVGVGTQVSDGSGFQGGAANPVVVTTNTGVIGGTTTRFNLQVANKIGATGDNYDLTAWNSYSAVGSAGFSSAFGTGTTAGYSVTFYAGLCPASGPATGLAITNTGNIAVGAAVNVCAQVSVPVTAAAGTVDIYFRVESQASVNYTVGAYAGFDVKHDAFVVAATSVVTFTPDRAGQTVPGGNVTYGHQLCNAGNTAAVTTLTLGAASTGFTSALWVDVDNSGTVNAGDTAVASGGTVTVPAFSCVSILDNVFAAASTTSGASNQMTITATVGGTAVGTTTDTTTVVTSDVSLLKEQREVTCTGGALGVAVGTANGTYTSGALPLKVNPGNCLQYRITATNSGALPATNLVISDMTPTYTTMSTGAAGVGACSVSANTGTVTTPTATAPANGAAGAITTSSVAVPSLQTVQLVFCVKVNT